MNKIKSNFNFEETLRKLEKIVESMEKGNQSLEKSLNLYEEGVKLTADLKQHLESAEQKVQFLISQTDNSTAPEK
ncbi:MAG: exodeoxyribonuclease VII small subunit [Candidatus Neomarinimicrobiota bacterium]